jgi:putative ABC transport system ATP-binding protein
MTAAPPVIRIRGLSKSYQRGEQFIPVLEGIDLDVNEAEFIALMGPSGSGKSTLLNLIAGIDQPTGGTIEIGGVTSRSCARANWPTGAPRTWASSSSSTT